MLKKVILSGVLALVGAVGAMAQTSDYKKSEFYVGYSNNQIDNGNGGSNGSNGVDNFFKNRESFNGFEAAGVANVHRYVGIKGDLSGTYKNQNVNFSNGLGTGAGTVKFDVNRSVYNFLGGVQIKDNSTEGRVKPFAHILVGAGHVRAKVKNGSCTGIYAGGCTNFTSSTSDTGVAGAFGGGLDIKAGDRISIRAFQVDYNPIRISGSTSNNVRFGAGIVF